MYNLNFNDKNSFADISDSHCKTTQMLIELLFHSEGFTFIDANSPKFEKMIEEVSWTIGNQNHG